MAKKLTKNKAKEILHDKSVHGHPLTDKQRKFFGAISGGAKPYKAQNGIEGTMGGLTNQGFNFNPAWGGAWENGGWMDKYEDGGNISKAQNGKVKNKDAKWIEDAATKHQKCGIGIEDPTCKTEPTLQFPGMPTYENMSNPVNLWNWPEGRKEQKAFMSNVDTRQQILSQQYPNLTKEALITALRDSARTNQLLNNPGYTKLFDEQGKLKDSTVRVEPFIKYWKEAYPEKTKITVPDMLQYLGQNIGNYENLINSGYRKFEDGGIIQPPMAGANQTVPMYAMGGSLPGMAGFTYARVAGAAPSEGKYAKKTTPSAQNGQEMKYFQAGLDWTPRNISENGSIIPMAQDGKSILPGYAQAYLAGNQGDIPKPSAEKFAEQKRIEEENKRVAAYNAFNQGRSYVGPTPQLTPYEEKKRQELALQKKQEYVATHPEQKLNEFGDLTLSPYGEFIQKYGDNLGKFAESWETPLAIEGVISGAPLLARGLASGARATGEYLTTQTPLRNAYKLNPWAGTFAGESKLPNFLQLNKLDDPNAFYRLTKDPKNYGLQEGAYFNKGVPLTQELAETFPKGSRAWTHRYSGLNYNPATGKIDMYSGPDYLFKVKDESLMEPYLNFPEPHLNFFRQSKNIPQGEAELFKKDWLRGYKEVPKPTSSIEDKLVGSFDSNNYYNAVKKFLSRPKLEDIKAQSVLSNFKERLKTPEGQKRLKQLGITETDVLNNIDLVSDPEILGHYWMNKIGIHPELPGKANVVRHEIEHGVQDAYNLSARKKAKRWYDKFINVGSKRKLNALNDVTTDIDKSLADLELRRTPEKVDWNANTTIQKDPSLYYSYLSDKKRATNYFDSGSEGREKSAFLGEVQQYMLDRGVIKHPYDKITPEMVKGVHADALFDEEGGGKYLRLFQIMKPTENNYKLISKNLNRMLGVVPAIGIGAAATTIENQKETPKKGFKEGGVVKDDMGYWNPENWGKVVEIDSNDITMEGVDQPLVGVSDEGDVQYMEPGNNYKFKGKKVTEYPVGKQGVSVNKADEYPLEKLDNLLNFTNYNKKAKNGGWLDKYKD